MAIANFGQLNLDEPTPIWGSRSLDRFEKMHQIGVGSYGVVYMAKEIDTGEIVALKKIRMESERQGFPVTAIREIKILKKLSHQNIIHLREVVTSSDENEDKGGVYLVFEYMDHDLNGLSGLPGMSFSIPQIKCYMKQLLTGLHYCHVNQVLHRDLKVANILLNNKGNLKLADFGLARSYSQNHSRNLTNQVTTLSYRPPELLLGATKYGRAIDIWSVGCIFGKLLTGRTILPGKTETEQLDLIYRLCGTPDENNWPGVSELPLFNQLKPSYYLKNPLRERFEPFDRHVVDLLEKMLVLDPSKRISAKDALDAEYFWTDPMPCEPESLPSYESSHEYQMQKRQERITTFHKFL